MNVELIIRVKEGDPLAFERVYTSYAKIIYTRVFRLLKDHDQTDEVVQKTFIKVWNSRSDIDVDKNFVHLIYRIADNMAIDSFRKTIKDRVLRDKFIDRYDELTKSLDEEYIIKERINLLEKAIAMLPPQRQIIFKMNKIDGQSYREISKTLSISESTISNQLVLASKFVRDYLVNEGKGFNYLFFLYFFIFE